jgi:hypothetical protein
MGLEVDVGSLTRYHTEGPADVVERIARQQEMAVTDGQDGGFANGVGPRLLAWYEGGYCPQVIAGRGGSLVGFSGPMRSPGAVAMLLGPDTLPRPRPEYPDLSTGK